MKQEFFSCLPFLAENLLQDWIWTGECLFHLSNQPTPCHGVAQWLATRTQVPSSIPGWLEELSEVSTSILSDLVRRITDTSDIPSFYKGGSVAKT